MWRSGDVVQVGRAEHTESSPDSHLLTGQKQHGHEAEEAVPPGISLKVNLEFTLGWYDFEDSLLEVNNYKPLGGIQLWNIKDGPAYHQPLIHNEAVFLPMEKWRDARFGNLHQIINPLLAVSHNKV
jgi:hypothetical protein